MKLRRIVDLIARAVPGIQAQPVGAFLRKVCFVNLVHIRVASALRTADFFDKYRLCPQFTILGDIKVKLLHHIHIHLNNFKIAHLLLCLVLVLHQRCHLCHVIHRAFSVE